MKVSNECAEVSVVSVAWSRPSQVFAWWWTSRPVNLRVLLIFFFFHYHYFLKILGGAELRLGFHPGSWELKMAILESTIFRFLLLRGFVLLKK